MIFLSLSCVGLRKLMRFLYASDIFERIMTSLRNEVAKLQDDELFDEILRRGSKAALETQPTTNDIDVLMRSMMGPAMNINLGQGSN